MSRLGEITPGAAIKGILPDSLVNPVNAQWFGSGALEMTYKDGTGRVGIQLLYRHDKPRIEIVARGSTVEFRWRWEREPAMCCGNSWLKRSPYVSPAVRLRSRRSSRPLPLRLLSELFSATILL